MQISTPITDQLGRYLNLSSQQLALTAANMANIDTPGYRTQGLDFAAEMRRSLDVHGGAGQDLSAAPGDAGAKVFQVDGLLERPDGNNVSIDRESLMMAQAQLQFRTGVELLKREFTRISNAIHEDK